MARKVDFTQTFAADQPGAWSAARPFLSRRDRDGDARIGFTLSVAGSWVVDFRILSAEAVPCAHPVERVLQFAPQRIDGDG